MENMDEFLQVICHDGFCPQTSYGHANMYMNRERNYHPNISVPPCITRERNYGYSNSYINKNYINHYNKNYDKIVKRQNYRENSSNGNTRHVQLSLEENEKKRIEHSKYVKGKKRGPKLKKTPDRTFPCQLCTYASTRKHDLKRHFIKIHHNDPEDRPKTETSTSKTNNDKEEDVMIDGKIKHSVIVKGQKRGPKMKHVYDKLFPCTLCTYVSTRKFDLKRHISVVHNKEKPFVCEICSFSAGLAETLKQHMLKMHNETKFKCASCNFACAKKPEYMRHLKDDHNYMPYGCDICNFTCLWNIELIQHKHKLHKNKSNDFTDQEEDKS